MNKERYFEILCNDDLGSSISEYLSEVEPYMESMRKEDKDEWYNDVYNDLDLNRFNSREEYDMNEDIDYDIWMYIYDKSDC